MKRIAIVTWTRWRNYGTILQSFALQQVVQRLGYDAYVLRDANIRFDYDIENYKAPTFFERVKGKWNSIFHSPKPSPYKIYDRELTDKCENFRLRNIKYWDVSFDNSDLEKIEPNFDAFICGSDQIWTSADNLFSCYYFLNFVKHKPKISYAPSISKNNYPQDKLAKMQVWLSTFKSVSVRENLGKQVLSQIYPHNIDICLDPTLLLSGQEWVEQLQLKKEPEDYVFCYFLGNQTWYKQESIAFCENKGLKMVFPPMIEADFDLGTPEYSPDPKEFLELILNAKYVLTDSFHAFIFSFLFRKEVFAFARFVDGDSASENSRVEEFSKSLGLQTRFIKEEGAILHPASPIDFDTADEKLSEMKKASIQYLRNSLNI